MRPRAESLSVLVHGFETCRALPAFNGGVDVKWIEFHPEAKTARTLGG